MMGCGIAHFGRGARGLDSRCLGVSVAPRVQKSVKHPLNIGLVGSARFNWVLNPYRVKHGICATAGIIVVYECIEDDYLEGFIPFCSR